VVVAGWLFWTELVARIALGGIPDTVQVNVAEPVCRRTFGIAWNKKHDLSEAAVHFHRSRSSFLQAVA